MRQTNLSNSLKFPPLPCNKNPSDFPGFLQVIEGPKLACMLFKNKE